MSQVAFSIRMEAGLKRAFNEFCDNVGMNMSTAFVVFAKAAVRERRFPFEISDYTTSRHPLRRVDGVWTDKSLDEIVSEKRHCQGSEVEDRGKRAWKLIKEQWAKNAETLDHDWTLDEVNALIDETRRDRVGRKVSSIA